MIGDAAESRAIDLARVRQRSVQLGSVRTLFQFHVDYEETIRRWLRDVPPPPEASAVSTTFELCRGAASARAVEATLADGAPNRLTRDGNHVRCEGPDGTGGDVDLVTGSGRIWAPVGKSDACWRAVHHCLRPLWYAVLARRGLHPLHASAVAGGHGAILIAGPSGAGKSTLAARLAHRGAAFLSDDVCFVDEASLDIVGLGDLCRFRPGTDPVPARVLDAEPNGKRPAFVGKATNGPARPRLLVLLVPVPAEGTTCRNACPGDAMATLMTSGFLSLDPLTFGPRMRTLAALVERCPAVLVNRGSAPPPDRLLASWIEGMPALRELIR